MEAERLDARNAALAVGALLVASVLVLVFRYAPLHERRLGLGARRDGPRGDRPRGTCRAPEVRTRPYPAVRGVYTLAGLGVIGALAEFGDQLFG